MVADEVAQGHFSLSSFYERRARRIFPALFAVMIFSTIVAAILFLPSEFQEFGRSIYATTLFVSNILFWKEAGYFDAPAELKPLLHTWSLAVEEQFYLIFPPLIYLMSRHLRGSLILWTGLLAAASFALGLYWLERDPDTAFYLTPMRGWELLVGALLAAKAIPENRTPWLREFETLAGLSLLIWCVTTYSSQTVFPGLNAVAPCIGAALIIHAGDQGGSTTTWALSRKPIVFTGLISYSLYLWHWPILVFAKYVAVRPLKPFETALCLVLAGAVSVLSWRFIEHPFRARALLPSKSHLLVGAALAMFGFIAIGVEIDRSRGWPGRMPEGLGALAHYHNMRHFLVNPDREQCYGARPRQVDTSKLCRPGAPNAEPSFILWGDSHSEVIRPALGRVAELNGKAGFFAGLPSCAPILYHGPKPPKQSRSCAEFNKEVLRFIEEQDMKLIILHATWITYLNRDASTGSQVAGRHSGRVGDELIETVKTLTDQGRKVVIIAGIPTIGYDVPRAVGLLQRFGRDIEAEIPATLERYLKMNAKAIEVFDRLSNANLARVIYPHEELCRGGWCNTNQDGLPLFLDSNHLSRFGADYVSPSLKPIFETAVQPSMIKPLVVR
jgi:peptidoglycan/LPS O-acetylase OafA/YrhL